jgi:hypothetical protein
LIFAGTFRDLTDFNQAFTRHPALLAEAFRPDYAATKAIPKMQGPACSNISI